jgi:glycosyltransferase involved in cell wall biosynthesis
LRADVRKGKGSSDTPDEGFAQWWLIQGRSEYPYWSYLSDAQKLALFEPAGKMAVGSLEQVVPKAMQLVLARRPDVMQKFSVDKNVNVAAVAGWFWIMGLIEHAMSKAVALDQIRALDRPVLVDPSLDPNPVMETPSPTVLMRMAWHLMSAEMQAQMDLNLSESRYRYLCWFFVVARPLFKFEAIIANRWKSWLLQSLPVSTANPANAALGELPRFAQMEYALMDAKTKPPLKTADDVEKLRAWSQEQTKANQKWAWLKQKIAYQDNGLPIDTAPIWRPSELLKEGATDAANAVSGDAGKGDLAKAKVQRPMGLNLFGFAFGELGLGEDLRMAVEVCKAAKIPYRVINISPGRDTGQADLALADELAKGPVSLPYAINVFCMPGFDVANRIFLRYGAKPFESYYNIGWWPWELDVWPKAWQVGFALADEIWSCSEFSDAMYRKSTNKPVTAMPLAASVARTQSHSRAHYGLPAKAYLYLYVFDFNSHVVRKNPQAAIDAFWLAFGKVPSKARPKTAVGLVLKVMNTKPNDPAWLAFEKTIASDARIHLISKTLARPEVLGLIESCDAYVSPHRAEGFGRTLAEAMLLGKPVIATNYSGNQFFMNPEVTLPVDYTLEEVKTGEYHFIESSDGARWAKPDTAHMAKRMQEAYEQRADKSRTAHIKHYAQSVFAPERTAMIMRQRLEQLAGELQARGLLVTK